MKAWEDSEEDNEDSNENEDDCLDYDETDNVEKKKPAIELHDEDIKKRKPLSLIRTSSKVVIMMKKRKRRKKIQVLN